MLEQEPAILKGRRVSGEGRVAERERASGIAGGWPSLWADPPPGLRPPTSRRCATPFARATSLSLRTCSILWSLRCDKFSTRLQIFRVFRMLGGVWGLRALVFDDLWDTDCSFWSVEAPGLALHCPRSGPCCESRLVSRSYITSTD